MSCPVVFDAYGTLFDVTAAARRASTEPDGAALAEAWPELAARWRDKQLQYTWLRTIAGAHADFAAVTAEALDWALEACGLAGDPALRARLLALYDRLDAFAEVPPMLAALREAGHPLAILSNGAPGMLASAVSAAGLEGVFDAVLSVEPVGAYKPARAVYDLVSARFGVAPGEVVFVSSNGWDAAAAAGYGFVSVWANRAAMPVDRLPWRPAHVLPDLHAVPSIAAAPEMRRFTTSDGRSLAYRDEGAGPVVLCLPGLSRNSRDFDAIAETFSGRYRVVRLDPRGRGGSERDRDFLNYNLDREGRDAVELLDHLDIGRATIVGCSRGGLIAMVLAGHAHDRLAGVVLNDIGPVVEQAGVARILTYLGLVPPEKTLDAAAAKAAADPGFPGTPLALWRKHVGRVWRATPTGLALDYDPRLRDATIALAPSTTNVDLWPLFELLHGIPLMVIRGANSDILGAEAFAEMGRRRPDATLLEVADRGHFPFHDEPELLAALDGFLDRTAR